MAEVDPAVYQIPLNDLERRVVEVLRVADMFIDKFHEQHTPDGRHVMFVYPGYAQVPQMLEIGREIQQDLERLLKELEVDDPDAHRVDETLDHVKLCIENLEQRAKEHQALLSEGFAEASAFAANPHAEFEKFEVFPSSDSESSEKKSS